MNGAKFPAKWNGQVIAWFGGKVGPSRTHGRDNQRVVSAGSTANPFPPTESNSDETREPPDKDQESKFRGRFHTGSRTIQRQLSRHHRRRKMVNNGCRCLFISLRPTV